MELNLSTCTNEGDYWRIRDFLREVLLLNDRLERSWQTYRFDYWRWHGIENMGHGSLEDDVFIWDTREGRIAAVLNREGPGNVHLQVHPSFSTSRLEDEMTAIAEKHLTIHGADGRQKLRIWCNEHDEVRQDVLLCRGYTNIDWAEYQRRRPLSSPISDVTPATGYTVRALGDVGEMPARSYASWKAFHPDDPDDRYEGWDWYKNIQRAPLYRRDLDIVAVGPAGEIAAFCTVWFDDVTRTGAFEPVGTVRAHQRQGLGKAVMCEGLRRLRRMGATMAYVGSYELPAHALYSSVGFTDFELSEAWEKVL